MAYVYDTTNIFARILRGEIPNRTVLETEHTLAFRDIAPKAPDHVLVIPKGPYVTYDHFCAEASEAEIVDFTRAVAAVVNLIGAEAHGAGKGFRAITNAGENGVQEVPHFHLHILAGRCIGPMICTD
ncbi:diadenosine tetraphosphate (Ap4A) HIT family hydrolase [Rhodobacter viridis]|uniref:Diadenosine tetraphosphate (Ap4A) HIT family hydrolase n=1 Tax=Rhodobacter viridis TaxID=1054202 RepID=A0A318TYV8_9RHOB|nr:HIT domain-containing protein [Rhodobacter viridis]PYF08208.1 diadenosine tetraphosphate (Ap4A) HIT family hydrolase [Rhodobacter viridis]